MSKKIQIIFTLSFLLNIIVLGVLLGGLYKTNREHHSYLMSNPVNEEMKKNIKSGRGEMRKDFNKIKIYKEELKDIVAAKEFDRNAYNIKISQIIEIKNTISQRKAKALGKTLSALSQTERKELSTHMLGKLLSGSPKGSRRHIGRDHMNKRER